MLTRPYKEQAGNFGYRGHYAAHSLLPVFLLFYLTVFSLFGFSIPAAHLAWHNHQAGFVGVPVLTLPRTHTDTPFALPFDPHHPLTVAHLLQLPNLSTAGSLSGGKNLKLRSCGWVAFTSSSPLSILLGGGQACSAPT